MELLSTTRPDLDDKMAADGDVYFYSPEQLDPEIPGVSTSATSTTCATGRCST